VAVWAEVFVRVFNDQIKGVMAMKSGNIAKNQDYVFTGYPKR
jgi:hypothetical protein